MGPGEGKFYRTVLHERHQSVIDVRHTIAQCLADMQMGAADHPFVEVSEKCIDDSLIGGVGGNVDVMDIPDRFQYVNDKGESREALARLNEEYLTGLR